MYILITNDDGIDSAGLMALAAAAGRRGHRLLIAAPKEQQSAASQRIQLNAPILVRQRDILPETEAWAVSGTPADCVRIGLELSGTRPDICISGINNGENAGCAVFYSGTVAAAREAAMNGIPALAVSIMYPATQEMLDALAEKAMDLAENLRPDALPRLTVLNLNAPALPPDQLKGLKRATLSQAFYQDHYEHRVSPRGQHYFWLGSGLPMEEPAPGTDYALLREGYMTLSLIGGYADFNGCLDDVLPDCPEEP